MPGRPQKEEIMILIDEEGVQLNFLVLDYFSLKEQEYAVLLPIDEEGFEYTDKDSDTGDDEEEGFEEENFEEESFEEEAIIFRVVKGNNGENTLQAIEDEEEWEKVAEAAYERLLASEE